MFSGVSFAVAAEAMTDAMREQHAQHLYYDRMARQYIIVQGALPQQSKPVIKSTCPNCGAPKHGAVCEYCKT